MTEVDVSYYGADFTIERIADLVRRRKILVRHDLGSGVAGKRLYSGHFSQSYIETLIVGLPVHGLFFTPRHFSVTSEDGYVIIDGRERVASIFEFLEGRIVLSERRVKPVSFTDLSLNSQQDLLNGVLHVTIVKFTSDSDDEKWKAQYHLRNTLNGVLD